MPTPRDASIEVDLSDTQAHLRVDPAWVVALVRDVLAGEGVGRAAVSIALVDDASIRAINRRHLDHDWPTDVITFPLSDGEDDEDGLAAELVVSAEMARTTAERAGADPMAELALYLVHGLLHLSGHDDATPADAAAMRRREGEVLAGLGLANTFALAGEPAGEGGGLGCSA